MTNTNELTAKLKAAAQKATALNLDTAQVKRGNGGYLECPCCEGAGYVEEENDFCNIDGVALGVQFYGIGQHHGLAEEYLRAANPANILALTEALEAAEKRIASLNEQLADCREIVSVQAAGRREMRQRIAELEGRTLTVKLPQRQECEGYHIDEAYLTPADDGDCYYRDDVIEAIKNACAAAGIKLQIEGE